MEVMGERAGHFQSAGEEYDIPSGTAELWKTT